MRQSKHVSLLIFLTITISCNGPNKEENTKQSSKKDRNMFGIGIPRGLTIGSEGLTPSYVMYPATNSATTYLINRKGEVVHEWKGNYGSNGAYLMNDGSLAQIVYDPDFPVFAGGGITGRMQKINWDSKILWDFEYSTEEYHAHHDFAVMPNGNILAIAWESKSYEEALDAGRKPEMIPKGGVWSDKIVEIEPDGKMHGNVVWEWHIWDHLVQSNDPKKANYGNPPDHPELLDFNVGRPVPAPISEDSLEILRIRPRMRNLTLETRGSDIYHFNAINYNSELDQIVFSSPSLSEIFIIDHSTTSEEAAGHSGGLGGKGGDFLYRWGNPENYGKGDSTNRKLFFQHDVRWVEKGKPGARNLTVFNNDVPGGPDSLEYSAIYEISPPIDETGQYVMVDNKTFGPEGPVWTYIAPDTVSFWSSFISGAHRMKNGNTFINEGAKGRFFEVTPSREIVWEYLNPYHGDIRKPNGDPVPLMPMVYSEFRSTFIPADHPAFVGKELKPLDPQPEVFVLPPKPADD